jgi:hypothetical protein
LLTSLSGKKQHWLQQKVAKLLIVQPLTFEGRHSNGGSLMLVVVAAVVETVSTEVLLSVVNVVVSAVVVAADVVDEWLEVWEMLQLEVSVVAVRSVVKLEGLHGEAWVPGSARKAKIAAAAMCFARAIMSDEKKNETSEIKDDKRRQMLSVVGLLFKSESPLRS